MEINKIYCMDNVLGMSQMDSESVDLTVTSPPYDKMRKYNGFTWDFQGVANQLFRITKIGGVVVWVVGDDTIKGCETLTSFQHALYFKSIGFNVWDTMIYQKNSSTPNAFINRYIQSFEYMFVFSKGKVKTFNPIMRPNKLAGKSKTPRSKTQRSGLIKKYGKNSSPKYHQESKMGNIWTYNTGAASGDDKICFKHPAPFQEQLAQDHIISWSNAGDLVLDPFMGSGTTAKMAKLLGRNFIGFDISQEYVNLANERLEE